MRTIFLAILLTCFDLAAIAQSDYSRATYVIPAAGATVNISCCVPPTFTTDIAVNTALAAVNLAGNSYTLTYDSLPNKGKWSVYCNFSQLTTSTSIPGQNVNIFGLYPLVQWPGATVFRLDFVIMYNGNTGVKYLHYEYVSGVVQQGGNVNAPSIFNAKASFYGGVQVQTGSPILAGSAVIAKNDSGLLGYGCVPWCTTGNAGLNGSVNFLGTTDTGSLSFRVDNLPAGIISYNKYNTSIGVASLYQTTGTYNTALGAGSMQQNTSGNYNAALGSYSGQGISTGTYNTALGSYSGQNISTGTYNTALGENALDGLTTGSYNVGVGQTSTQLSSTHNSVALGNVTVSSNQFGVGGAENIYLPGVNSRVGYVLTDTSGTGNFVPTAPFGTTGTVYSPVTGDSIANVSGVQTSKNTINPAGTLANLTIVFPANPVPYQSYFFNFQQAITALHYSIRLSGGANPVGLPSSEPQYGTFSAYYDPNILTWVAGSH